MKPTDLYQGSTGEKRSRDLMIFCRVAVWMGMVVFICAVLWGCKQPPKKQLYLLLSVHKTQAEDVMVEWMDSAEGCAEAAKVLPSADWVAHCIMVPQ